MRWLYFSWSWGVGKALFLFSLGVRVLWLRTIWRPTGGFNTIPCIYALTISSSIPLPNSNKCGKSQDRIKYVKSSSHSAYSNACQLARVGHFWHLSTMCHSKCAGHLRTSVDAQSQWLPKYPHSGRISLLIFFWWFLKWISATKVLLRIPTVLRRAVIFFVGILWSWPFHLAIYFYVFRIFLPSYFL